MLLNNLTKNIKVNSKNLILVKKLHFCSKFLLLLHTLLPRMQAHVLISDQNDKKKSKFCNYFPLIARGLI